MLGLRHPHVVAPPEAVVEARLAYSEGSCEHKISRIFRRQDEGKNQVFSVEEY